MDNIEDLMLLIRDSVEKSLQVTVSNEIKDLVTEEIKKEVYEGEFQPNRYERRYEIGVSGSYGDEEMLNTTCIASKNGTLITITNDAKGGGDDKGSYISEIIETGKGYKWTRRPNARPVFKNVRDDIIEQDLVYKVLKSDLSKIGINIK